MAEVVIFHHACGLTPGVLEFAASLRSSGHTVHTPDLYDGRTFSTIDGGVVYAGEVGFGTVVDRGNAFVANLPTAVVYLGFSLGVLPAQSLAQNRPGALGALFVYSCVPVSALGGPWPAGVPVQVHAMQDDPYFVDNGDLEAARDLVASTDTAELFLYPGSDHIFADTSLSTYHADAAGLLVKRVLDFLQQCGE